MKTLFSIGSVVRVKDAEKDLMIIGIMQRSEKGVFDYLGVLYPEGYLDAEHVYLFNHEDIVSVEYLGYYNAEMQAFRNELSKYLESEAKTETNE